MADPTERSEAIAVALNPTCGSCRWFDRTEVGKAGGQCHGTTPTVIPVGLGMHPITQKQFPIVDGFWPPVMDTTRGCRHHVYRSMKGLDLSTVTNEEVGGEA